LGSHLVSDNIGDLCLQAVEHSGLVRQHLLGCFSLEQDLLGDLVEDVTNGTEFGR